MISLIRALVFIVGRMIHAIPRAVSKIYAIPWAVSMSLGFTSYLVRYLVRRWRNTPLFKKLAYNTIPLAVGWCVATVIGALLEPDAPPPPQWWVTLSQVCGGIVLLLVVVSAAVCFLDKEKR